LQIDSPRRVTLKTYKTKWGSCLSTVTTTGCGFVFERESVKADIEWVG
jgi:predicted metal-dependent hydrolase